MVFLTACGGAGDYVLKIGDKEVTKDDYIKSLNNLTVLEDRQNLIMEEISKVYVDDAEVEKRYEKEIESYLNYIGDDREITEEEKDGIREWVEIDVGIVGLYKELGIITDKILKENYEEGSKGYVITSATFSTEDISIKEVEKMFKDGKDVGEKITELGPAAYYDESVDYMESEIPYEIGDVIGKEKGFVGTQEYEGYGIVYILEDVKDLTFEEAEEGIIRKIVGETELGIADILEQLEDAGKIEVTKELREYLQLDDDMVQGLEDEEDFGEIDGELNEEDNEEGEVENNGNEG